VSKLGVHRHCTVCSHIRQTGDEEKEGGEAGELQPLLNNFCGEAVGNAQLILAFLGNSFDGALRTDWSHFLTRGNTQQLSL